jgi:hypothetical protein
MHRGYSYFVFTYRFSRGEKRAGETRAANPMT